MSDPMVTVPLPASDAVLLVNDWNFAAFDDSFEPNGLPGPDSLNADVGYLIVRTPGLADQSDAVQAERVTALANSFGNLFRVFGGQPGLWRKLDVDLDRPSERSRGTGSQPLHLDFVNTSMPPDYVFLYCQRSDPAGGGASALASVADIAVELSPHAIEVLSRPIYSDGETRNLLGVGTDINPFPVLQPDSQFALRFTGRLLETKRGDEIDSALRELQTAIDRRANMVTLAPGDLLVVDQRIALHGRRALGEGQSRLHPEERRLLRHAFGRARRDATFP